MSDIDINQVLSQLRSMASAAQGINSQAAPAAEGGDFSTLLKAAIGQVSENQQQARAMAEAFEKGDTTADITEVMVSMQKARVSFQAMLEVRNKLVTAYQDVMNMSI